MSNYRASLEVGGPRFMLMINASANLYHFCFNTMAQRPFDYGRWSLLHQEYLLLREEAFREFRRYLSLKTDELIGCHWDHDRHFIEKHPEK